MTDDAELDLSCQVCGQSATLTDVTPLRYEHAVDTFARVHAHPDSMMAAHRASVERVQVALGRDDDQGEW